MNMRHLCPARRVAAASSVCSILFTAPLVTLCLLAALLSSGSALAALGLAAEDDEIPPMVTTLFGERVLLFMENPQLVQGESARFLAHFSVLANGEPVRAGRAVLQVGATTLAVDAPKRDGLFIPEGSFPEAGSFPVSLSITSEQATESLDLGSFTVHANAVQARAASEAAAEEEPANAVSFLMEAQWKLRMLIEPAQPRQLIRRLPVPGQVVTAEGAAAIVSSPVSGRLSGPDGGKLPTSGRRVEAGTALALVEPPLLPADAAQLRALALEWNLKSLEIDQAMAQASARLQFRQSDHDRVSELRAQGLATQMQLEQAQRDLTLALEAAAAASNARAALDAQRDREAAADARFEGGILRYILRAPIAGIVVGKGHVVGESIEAGEALLRIVDDSQLWVEGRVSEFDLHGLGPSPVGVVGFPSLPALRIPLGGSSDAPLLSLGPELDTFSRTLLVRFALPSQGPASGSPQTLGPRPGMLADLELALEQVDAPVSIPFEAVVMEQGAPTAYVMLSGETFQKRDLVLGLRDGRYVEVRSGIRAGEPVATRAANSIRMAALAPESFGHGHEH